MQPGLLSWAEKHGDMPWREVWPCLSACPMSRCHEVPCYLYLPSSPCCLPDCRLVELVEGEGGKRCSEHHRSRKRRTPWGSASERHATHELLHMGGQQLRQGRNPQERLLMLATMPQHAGEAGMEALCNTLALLHQELESNSECSALLQSKTCWKRA